MKTRKEVDLPNISRRSVIRSGLAGLAAAVASPMIPACDPRSAAEDAGTMGGPDGGAPDAATIDSGGDDSGAPVGCLPWRETPPRPALRSLIGEMGPLQSASGSVPLRLAPGFTGREVARSLHRVEGTGHHWHLAPDGGATFATADGGWIYVSNSEVPLHLGGVSAIRFGESGDIVDAYPILGGTSFNCAGGPTPWNTWLSCEEVSHGRVYETDPWGEAPAIVRPALGIFKHEAVTVDPVRGQLYLTEDEVDGLFYRFTPAATQVNGCPDLRDGRLDVAQLDEAGNVTWHTLPDPQRASGAPTRTQVPVATPFDGGEGIWHHEGIVYMSTKCDTRVWRYDIAAARMEVLYDGEALVDPPLTGVDNITVSCCGDVLVAEDGGSMQVVAILPSGELKPLVQVVGQDGSEITGPAFDPSGTRLYFSSQRGSFWGVGGITYEVTGPFHEPV